ncbi:unnamed protein product [Ectocarpus sp. 12 AP-2014]
MMVYSICKCIIPSVLVVTSFFFGTYSSTWPSEDQSVHYPLCVGLATSGACTGRLKSPAANPYQKSLQMYMKTEQEHFLAGGVFFNLTVPLSFAVCCFVAYVIIP